jgi:hypothetical protein
MRLRRKVAVAVRSYGNIGSSGLDLSVAVRAQQDALGRLLAHACDRARAPIAQREGFGRAIEVVELKCGWVLVIAAPNASAAGLSYQRRTHARSPADDGVGPTPTTAQVAVAAANVGSDAVLGTQQQRFRWPGFGDLQAGGAPRLEAVSAQPMPDGRVTDRQAIRDGADAEPSPMSSMRRSRSIPPRGAWRAACMEERPCLWTQ